MIFNMAVERLWKPKKRNEYYIRGPLRLLSLIVHPVSQAVLETEIIYESETCFEGHRRAWRVRVLLF